MREVDAAAIRERPVRKKYAEVAQSAEGKFAYPTGRQGALGLGYDESVLECLPDEILASCCGVGRNPFACGPIKQGEAILDVGCGAGIDMWPAASSAPRGKSAGLT